jgi:hypothetical protein
VPGAEKKQKGLLLAGNAEPALAAA